MKLEELLFRLKNHYGSADRLRQRLHVSDKTIHTWLHKSEDDLQRLQPDHIDAIKRAGRDIGLAPELGADGPQLWNSHLPYVTNISYEPELPLEIPTFRRHRTEFLGYSLNSPFGASSSPLTSTPQRIRFLAGTGCDLISFVTVRSGDRDPHPGRNILFCADSTVPLDPEARKLPSIQVSDEDGRFRSTFGMVNRFGIPSPPPEIWKARFNTARLEMLNGQLLILSVTGTSRPDEPFSALVKDFVSVTRLAVEAGATVLEVNLGNHNTSGKENGLHLDLRSTLEICRELANERLSAKIILKIGFMPTEHLKRFVLETVPYVHGYSAINTVPVAGMEKGQLGLEPAFGKPGIRAGVSGAPIQRLGLRCISDLASIRAAERLNNIGIIAGGGIVKPENVKTYLDLGADAVQATTAFWADSYFGLRVRQHLDQELQHRESSADHEREEARLFWSRAVQELEKEVGGGNAVLAEISKAGLDIFLEWSRNHEKTINLGPRRPLALSVRDFKERIRERMRKGSQR